MVAVMERERVADACTWFDGCPGEVKWLWRPSPSRPDTYPLCDSCKQAAARGFGPGEFRRIAESTDG